MKRVEVKEIGLNSAFKAMLYISSPPLLLLGFISIILIIVGIVIGQQMVLFIGISYFVAAVASVLLYGVFAIVGSLVYNKLSERFGGLVLTVKEEHDNQGHMQ